MTSDKQHRCCRSVHEELSLPPPRRVDLVRLVALGNRSDLLCLCAATKPGQTQHARGTLVEITPHDLTQSCAGLQQQEVGAARAPDSGLCCF